MNGSSSVFFHFLYSIYKTIAAITPIIENTFANPILRTTKPAITHKTFSEVELLFINCLKMTYNNQTLTPKMINGPRLSKNTSNANSATENNKNFFMYICLLSRTYFYHTW